jgi:SAM-dependent methyltransferase
MKRWQEYSKDPNDPALRALRQAEIAKARAPATIAERVAYLCALAAGKSVLDIGVVEHTRGAAESPAWLHGHIRRHAAQCLGVDVLETEVAGLRERGYNVICADVTREPLPQRFELIIAGEVIEHVDAPGSFMRNCAAMLEPGGRLVLTTPNPFYANVMLKNGLRRYTFVESADHVAWYDASVLYELGQRAGLRIDRFTGIGGAWPNTMKGRIFFALRPLLLALGSSPELFAKTIVYEFLRDPAGMA